MQALTTLLPSIPVAVWWVLVVVMVGVGIAGTVLPVLPGTLLVLGGLFVGAWIHGFTQVGTWPMSLIAVLAVLAWVTDYVAGLLGARHVGASKWALIGAAAGTVVGLFMGLVGVLFMPFVGAVIGEWYALRQDPSKTMGQDQAGRALKVGTATWIGIMVGTAIKIGLAFVMIGVFVVALLIQ